MSTFCSFYFHFICSCFLSKHSFINRYVFVLFLNAVVDFAKFNFAHFAHSSGIFLYFHVAYLIYHSLAPPPVILPYFYSNFLSFFISMLFLISLFVSSVDLFSNLIMLSVYLCAQYELLSLSHSHLQLI